jgi:hypothetical protein
LFQLGSIPSPARGHEENLHRIFLLKFPEGSRTIFVYQGKKRCLRVFCELR